MAKNEECGELITADGRMSITGSLQDTQPQVKRINWIVRDLEKLQGISKGTYRRLPEGLKSIKCNRGKAMQACHSNS